MVGKAEPPRLSSQQASGRLPRPAPRRSSGHARRGEQTRGRTRRFFMEVSSWHLECLKLRSEWTEHAVGVGGIPSSLRNERNPDESSEANSRREQSCRSNHRRRCRRGPGHLPVNTRHSCRSSRVDSRTRVRRPLVPAAHRLARIRPWWSTAGEKPATALSRRRMLRCRPMSPPSAGPHRAT